MRLTRIGRKHDPSFRVVVTESTKPAKGKYLASVGFYNPRLKQVKLDAERIREWLSKGVQPTDVVHNLLIKEGVTEGKKIAVHATKPAAPAEEGAKEEAPASTEAEAPATADGGAPQDAVAVAETAATEEGKAPTPEEGQGPDQSVGMKDEAGENGTKDTTEETSPEDVSADLPAEASAQAGASAQASSAAPEKDDKLEELSSEASTEGEKPAAKE